ncbi:uncharacterized protein LOC101453542 isoform X2 [Ceratitis capitata]|uniref:uncharacterized protein LOC101453542 isoform X2 n=1 Tax=Ceratitis capitata TaxID=7213 RepID=UPI000329B5E1|nr:uncharacterized protein LOC101453542 isoform X2 [Ceratitis capitata]
MNSIASITAPTTVHIKKVQRRQLATPSRGSQCCGRSLIELAFKRLFGKRLEADRVAKYCLELQKRKYTTRTVENRLTKLKSKVSTSTCSVTLWRLAVKYKLRQDSVHMMIILFAVIMSVVISENTALASQRDSIKQKNPNNLSTNLNAIPTGGGIGTSATNGNFANGNPNNNKHGGNDISNQRNNTTTVTSDYGGNYLTTSATTTQSTATATMTVPSNTSSAVYNGTAQKNSGAFLSGTSVMNRNTIELTEDARNGPYFDKAASKNITALLGKTAYLNCRVKNLGNKTMLLQVSWVRHRDIHLLTVGRYTYTSDQRFRAIHQPQTEDWILQIKYPQHRDSGIYECQVSTTPHMSHYIHLNVVEPSTEIIGAPDLYIESGSTINLTCVILNSPEPPAYIFWNHNNAIINYDSPRGGVSVVTNKGETTTSFLLIKSARPSDSGHYQCNPSNAKPKSVTVHVLNGEFPAAMQRAGPAYLRMSQSRYLLVYLSMYLCTLAYTRWYMPLLATTGTRIANM